MSATFISPLVISINVPGVLMMPMPYISIYKPEGDSAGKAIFTYSEPITILVRRGFG
jgi:hypothetical protein